MRTSELEDKLQTRIPKKVAVVGLDGRLFWRQSDGETWVDYEAERQERASDSQQGNDPRTAGA